MASINTACNTLAPSKNGVELSKLLADVLVDMRALRTQLNQLRTDFSGHVHGGVTAGAANTAAAATTATAVTLVTTE